MFSQIAQVFSSSGVLRPGMERIPAYGKPKIPASDQNAGVPSFASRFDQASAKLELSKRGVAKSAAEASAAGGRAAFASPAGPDAGAGPEKADGKPLSEEERKQVAKLEKRDREVKAHEAAHEASAGGNARGGASYEYEKGPDGKQYAIGGHVDIDVSPVQGNPSATLEKALTVQRAALAPADPSGADRAVAAAAAQMAAQAQKEIPGNPGAAGGPAIKRGGNADGGRDPRRAYAGSASRAGTVFSAVG